MNRRRKRTDAQAASETETERSDRSNRDRSGSGSDSGSRRVESLQRSVGNRAIQRSVDRSATAGEADRLGRSPGGAGSVLRSPRNGGGSRGSGGGSTGRSNAGSDRVNRAGADRTARGRDDGNDFELAADRVMRSADDRADRSQGSGLKGPATGSDRDTRTATGGGSAGGSVEEVSPETVQRKRDRGADVAVVDVRDPSSFASGHVPGATNVPLSDVSRRPADVEGADEVVSCCRSGRRSREAARRMADDGGPRVVNMEGGYERWRREVGSGSAGRSPAGTGAGSAGGSAGSDCGCDAGPSARDLGGDLQASLSVSDPGDAREREAERVADQVMRMDDPTRAAAGGAAGGTAVAAGSGGVAAHAGGPTATAGTRSDWGEREAGGSATSCSSCGDRIGLSTRSSCEADLGRTSCSSCGASVQRAVCSECEELHRATCSACEDDEELRRSGEGDAVGGSEVGGGVERRIQRATAGGQGLSESTRSYFEPRFGRDFGDVRVHTGEKADAAARSVNAEAFTVGNDVVFRKGAYDPASEGGKRLLAHELTHIVQQNGGDPARAVAQRQAAAGGGGATGTFGGGATGTFGGGESGGKSGEGPTGSEPFLPMQIRCVREAGGCGMGSMALGPINETCRTGGGVIGQGTGYEGPDLRREDLNCGSSTGKTVADAVQSAYSGWTGVLPDCPCTVEAAKASSEFANTAGPWSEVMHRGAEYDFRAAGYSTAAGTNHGQQCMYDATGQLITVGPGRGTPDVWGPQPKTYFPYHYAIDVMTAEELSASKYRSIWTPNTGAGCPDNRPGSSGESGGSKSGPGSRAAGGAAGGRKGSGSSGASASSPRGETCGGCSKGGWEPGSNGCSVPDLVTEVGGGIEGFDVDVFYSANKPLGEDGPSFGSGCGGDGPCDVHDRDYQTCESDFAEDKVSELPAPEEFDSHESYWKAHRSRDTLLVNYGWKEEADRKFEQGMKQACASHYEGETAWFSDTPYEDCMAVADVYATFVSDAFSDAYDQRQYQACTCDLMKNPGSLLGNVSEASWTRMLPGIGAGKTWPW